MIRETDGTPASGVARNVNEKHMMDARDVTSVFSLGTMTGWIYVEASNSHIVRTLCAKSRFTRPNTITPISIEDRPGLFRKINTSAWQSGAWVRIKYGAYSRDIARVQSSVESVDGLHVTVVPRIKDPTNNAQKRKVNGKKKRPDPFRVNLQLAKVWFGSTVRESEDGQHFYVKSSRFDRQGFRVLPVQAFQIEHITPTIDQLSEFIDAVLEDISETKYAERDDQNIPSLLKKRGELFDAEDWYGGDVTDYAVFEVADISPTSIAMPCFISIGAEIIIERGEMKGSRGTVMEVSTSTSTLTVQLKDEPLASTIEIDNREVHEVFKAGDEVEVKLGMKKGLRGLVSSVSTSFVFIIKSEAIFEVSHA